MADPRTIRFIEALHAAEEERALDRLVCLFSDDAEIHNPVNHHEHRGLDGAREFWGAYRGSFAEIRSEFRNVLDSGDVAMLEWVTRGRTARDEPVVYGGVSVLEFEGDRIRRFRSYFDTSELAEKLAGRRPGEA